MSKKYKRIMEDVAARWKETLTATATPDLAPAKKLLIGKSKSTRVFVVDTPMQFYIGQAVLRGRVSLRPGAPKARGICSRIPRASKSTNA